MTTTPHTHPNPTNHPAPINPPAAATDLHAPGRDVGDRIPVGFHGTLTVTTGRPLAVRVLAVVVSGLGMVAGPVARLLEPVLVTAAWLALPAAGIAYLTGHPDTVGLGAAPHLVWWLIPLAAAGTVLVMAITADLIAHHHAQTRAQSGAQQAQGQGRVGSGEERW